MNLQRRALLCAVGGLIAVSCGVATPPPRIMESAVQIVADGCGRVDVHGAGLMVAEGRVATVAHVVAGATRIEVRGIHGATAATVVYFDPINDVAVLKVDAGLAAPVAIGAAAPGDHGNVIVYRDDAPVELPAEVRRIVDIRTADIYGEGKHLRPGYELTLDIQAGDSGAVVVVDDRAVALVWAKSRQAEVRAWAMRTSLIADHLSVSAPVDHGRCA
jgi:trypsin-like peptidase